MKPNESQRNACIKQLNKKMHIFVKYSFVALNKQSCELFASLKLNK